jgi:hypothetical protein
MRVDSLVSFHQIKDTWAFDKIVQDDLTMDYEQELQTLLRDAGTEPGIKPELGQFIEN